MSDATFFRTGRKSWTNRHESYREKVSDLYDLHNPRTEATSEGLRRTTAMIQGLLREAMDKDVPVLALGGGWSFSRAPVTDGWMLNTKPLNWIFPISAGSVVSDWAERASHLFLVQCGCTISEINRTLETRVERSLRTSGASNGQTLAGAMSTGTHGSAIDVGAIQDHVLGMHVILSPDRHVWLEPASKPVVSSDFIDKLGAELVRDDTLFDAAIVSLGGFGVIHALMIEVTDRFLLEAHRERSAYNDALEKAISSLDFEDLNLPDPSSRPYFFQMVLDPYAESKPAFVTTMYKRAFVPDHEIDYSESGGLGPGYDLLGPLGSLTDKVPDLTPFLVSKITEERLKPTKKPKVGTLGETFDFSTPRSKAAGAAVGVPLERSAEALRLMRNVLDETGPAPVVFACRFVRRSKGLLSFTRFDPTCVIDIDGVASKRTRRFYEKLWQALRDSGIPHSLHWGKMNSLDAEAVRFIYGDNVDSWLTARRQLLPHDSHRRLFSSPFLERLGLGG